MNALTEHTIPAVGTAMLGGFFAGLVNINGQTKGIIVAPKSTCEYKVKWSESEVRIQGAECPVDGQQNTLDMIAAGAILGKWVQALNIDGFTDWHIPSRDQMEIIYRAFKSTTDENWPCAGVNISSVPPHNLYTNNSPAQCELAEFKEGGEQAFDTACYWTSTQVGEAYAWIQHRTMGTSTTTGRPSSPRSCSPHDQSQ